MEFRWVVIIALWTLLSAPVFDSGSPAPRAARLQPVAVAASTLAPDAAPER
jgi:hypothetical protein